MPTATDQQQTFAMHPSHTHRPSADREHEVTALLPQVRAIAWQYARHRPQGLDLEDLISVGTIGLLEAWNHYDPARGAQFKTFALHRVRGAMLDEMRSMNWVPRGPLQQIGALYHTTQVLEQRYGCHPVESEIADELGVSLEAVDTMRRHAQNAKVLSLTEFAVADEEQLALPHDESPFHELLEKETQQILEHSVAKLSPRQRSVISQYYFENRTMKEIGVMLNVTESRVSQLRSQALRNLRKMWKHTDLRDLHDNDRSAA